MKHQVKKPPTSGNGVLDLFKLLLPLMHPELVYIVKEFLPKTWAVPRKTKKHKSKLHQLRIQYDNTFGRLFDHNTRIKVRETAFRNLTKEKYKRENYIALKQNNIIGKVIGYTTNEYLYFGKIREEYNEDVVLYVVQFHHGLSNARKGNYHLHPSEVRFYLDIEDRKVMITKKNKIIFV